MILCGRPRIYLMVHREMDDSLVTSVQFQEFGVSSALAKASEIVRWRFVDFMLVADMYICARCLRVKTHYLIRTEFTKNFAFRHFAEFTE